MKIKRAIAAAVLVAGPSAAAVAGIAGPASAATPGASCTLVVPLGGDGSILHVDGTVTRNGYDCVPVPGDLGGGDLEALNLGAPCSGAWVELGIFLVQARC